MRMTFACVTSSMLISLKLNLGEAMQEEEPWLCFLSPVGTRVLIVLYKAAGCWACPRSRWGEKVFMFLSSLPPSLCCTKTNKQMVGIDKERSSVLQIIAFSARKHVATFNFVLEWQCWIYKLNSDLHSWDFHEHFTQVFSKCNVLK